MPFTGKATFTAGASLPEIVEEVADIVSIVSPHETPLLDHLGDAHRTQVQRPGVELLEVEARPGPAPGAVTCLKPRPFTHLVADRLAGNAQVPADLAGHEVRREMAPLVDELQPQLR